MPFSYACFVCRTLLLWLYVSLWTTLAIYNLTCFLPIIIHFPKTYTYTTSNKISCTQPNNIFYLGKKSQDFFSFERAHGWINFVLVKKFPSCYFCVLTHTTHIDIHLHNFNTFFLKSLSVLVFQERCSQLKIVLVILGACGFRLISCKNKKVYVMRVWAVQCTVYLHTLHHITFPLK